jgi:hypothetical protein
MGVLEIRSPQHLGLQSGGLRLTGITSIVVATASLLIRPLIITIIVSCPHRSIISIDRGS